jgi:biopolymer transport protein ExbB/TolQ
MGSVLGLEEALEERIDNVKLPYEEESEVITQQNDTENAPALPQEECKDKPNHSNRLEELIEQEKHSLEERMNKGNGFQTRLAEFYQ